MPTKHSRVRLAIIITIAAGLVIVLGCVSNPTVTPSRSIEELQAAALVNLPYDSLMRNTENYVGQVIYYQGEVAQVMEEGGETFSLRIDVTRDSYGFWDDTVLVHYRGQRILENDIVEFWATVEGRITYTAIMGNKITIPELSAHRLVVLPEEQATIAVQVVTEPTLAAVSESAVTQTPAPTPTLRPTPVIGKVGQRVELAGIALTVTKVERTDKILEFLSAKEGNIYVIADLLIENIGNDRIDYNLYSFKVKDGDAYEYQPGMAPDPMLQFGSLEPGEKVRGNVGFEIKAEATQLVLSYSLEMFTLDGKTIRIALD